MGTASLYTDTKRAAINSTHKKFSKKVQDSCNITKGCFWLEAHLKQFGDCHHAVWESNYKVIKTEWELSLKESCNSFEVNKMTVRTDQLLQIKETTYSKKELNHMVQILPRRHKGQNAALHLLSSQASEHKFDHSLNHSRLPWIHFQVSLHSVR